MAMEIKRFNKDKENIVGFLLNDNLYSVDGKVYQNFKVVEKLKTRVNPKVRLQMEKLYKDLIGLNKIENQIKELNSKYHKARLKAENDNKKLKEIYEKESGVTKASSLGSKVVELFDKTNLKKDIASLVKDGISSGYVGYYSSGQTISINIPIHTIRHPKEGDFGCVFLEYDNSLSVYTLSDSEKDKLIKKAQYKKWNSLNDFTKDFKITDRRVKTTCNISVEIGDKTADLCFGLFYDFSKDEFSKEESKELLKKFKAITKKL